MTWIAMVLADVDKVYEAMTMVDDVAVATSMFATSLFNNTPHSKIDCRLASDHFRFNGDGTLMIFVRADEVCDRSQWQYFQRGRRL
jgi:hypothetical protein